MGVFDSIRKITIGMLLVSLISSCVKNDYTKIDKEVVWNPNFSIPLGKSKFTTSNLNLPPDFLGGSIINTPVFVADTIPYNFLELFINTDSINYLMFRVFVENGFPAQLKAQAYFLNGGDILLDSLFITGPAAIAPAEVDSNGKLKNVIKKTIDEYRTDGEINILEGVSQILIVVWLSDFSEDVGNGESLEDYYINLELGLQADIEKINHR